LPAYILDRNISPDWQDIFQGLKLTGYFLERNFSSDWRNNIFSSRDILIDRLKRVVA
jgi:DNA repair protein RecO (recombination protein O)